MSGARIGYAGVLLELTRWRRKTGDHDNDRQATTPAVVSMAMPGYAFSVFRCPVHADEALWRASAGRQLTFVANDNHANRHAVARLMAGLALGAVVLTSAIGWVEWPVRAARTHPLEPHRFRPERANADPS